MALSYVLSEGRRGGEGDRSSRNVTNLLLQVSELVVDNEGHVICSLEPKITARYLFHESYTDVSVVSNDTRHQVCL